MARRASPMRPSASKWRRWRPSRHRRRWFGRSDDRELSALAALELKRRCVGFDISDEYVRVATRAWSARMSDVALWDQEPAVLNARRGSEIIGLA